MIYLDHHATTPVDERVLAAMLPHFTQTFGNPSSRNHRFGWDARDAVERARRQVAALAGASARDIVFTSGATEANNLALKGLGGRGGSRRQSLRRRAAAAAAPEVRARAALIPRDTPGTGRMSGARDRTAGWPVTKAAAIAAFVSSAVT